MRPLVPLALALVACLFVPAAAGPPAPDELAGRIDTYVRPFVEVGHLSGTLLVARGEDIVYEQSWGLANRELGVANTPDTRFCIASVTKPITIALVCRMAEQGKMLPDQAISTWLPGFPRGDEITVSHLLNHRACIPHRVTTAEQETVPRSAADMVELVSVAEMLPHAIGEKSVYSSAGFSVLARVCELASGMSYADAIDSLVFRPAGMTRSGHYDARTIVPDRAAPYFATRNGFVNGPLQDLSFLVGAGSVVSTPRDLHRMLRALLDGSLGDAARIALLREDGVSWNGVTNGFRAFVEYDKATDTAVIFAGNLITGATDYVRRDVPRIAAGEDVAAPPPLERQFVDVPEDVLRGYEGTFMDARGSEITMEVRQGQLYSSQWLLLPTSSTTFFSPQDYATVTVVFGDAGRVASLDWARVDGVWQWRKVEAGS
jgi:CubicO group peptidase (beta-lactamase class C family)